VLEQMGDHAVPLQRMQILDELFSDGSAARLASCFTKGAFDAG
jgi:hypothetical protein